jgi:organic radical activating enzyme
LKLNCNCCDGIYNSFDVHFTSKCDNKCAHCIDMRFSGVKALKPDGGAIVKTIVDNCEGVDDVLFLGGEPCLYLDTLVWCVRQIKRQTKLKVYVTTSVPKICYDDYTQFHELMEMLDGINLSVQHHDEYIADLIRGTKSRYNRQQFYATLPYKEKIRINLNIVKPHLSERGELLACLQHYDAMGFNSIKLSEIQHGKEAYVSFADLFGRKMPSAYSDGCQSYINVEGIKTPLLLKRSCFLCEDTLKATFMDGIKVLSKVFTRPKNKYGVIYANGQLEKGWI